jgi:hypothetical protein
MINEQTIRQACSNLADILIKKNKDYGNSVQEQFDEYGETSLLIRLDDKLRRLKQLQKAPAKVTSESKQDTMLDLAGYSILGLLCLSSEETTTLSVDLIETEPVEGYRTFKQGPTLTKTITIKSPFEEQYDINFNPHFDQDDQH